MEQFCQNADLLVCLADKLDFTDACKLPQVCTAARSALDWSTVNGYLESRVVRFVPQVAKEYLVRGNGWIHGTRPATIFRKVPRSPTMMVGGQRRKITKRYTWRGFVEHANFDPAKFGCKARSFSAADVFMPAEHQEQMEAENGYWSLHS